MIVNGARALSSAGPLRVVATRTVFPEIFTSPSQRSPRIIPADIGKVDALITLALKIEAPGRCNIKNVQRVKDAGTSATEAGEYHQQAVLGRSIETVGCFLRSIARALGPCLRLPIAHLADRGE